MRLLLDEMVSAVVAEQLRDRGWDVVAVQEPVLTHLRGLDDRVLFEAAQEFGRAIVTDNVSHFVECVRAFAGEDRPHHGVLLFTNETFPRHRHERFVAAILRSLEEVLAAHPREEPESLVLFLRGIPPEDG